jgi:hypothetical protein
MASGLSDTHPEAEAILMRLYRETPAWRKWELMCQLNEMAQGLAIQGFRDLHPNASESEIQRLLADLVLGKELSQHLHDIAPDKIGNVHLNEIIPILRRFVDVLESSGIRYVIGGSIASSSYADPRFTYDADILVDLRLEQVNRLAEELGEDFYADPNMMRDAIQRRSSFNIIHYPTMLKIDVFIPKARNFDQGQFGNRQLRAILQDESALFYVASPEDIILAKLEWYRMGNEVSERQWKDLMGVLKPRVDLLDVNYMRQAASELDVSDLLERALSEA